MDSSKKRNLFLAATILLVAVLVVVSVAVIAQGPRESSVELISETSTEYVVNDLYEGEMNIPKFNIPTSKDYKPDKFLEKKGIVTYEGGDSFVGINVNYKRGDIDWAQVAENVDYAMIRVGYRGKGDGKICLDSKFEENIKGALDADLPVGVYFYSKAVTEAEAEEEAAFVLEQIRNYSVTYPVAFYWEYDLKDDGSKDEESRTIRCNGDQVSGFINAFCKKVKATGRTASFYCDKSMGYNSLDLEMLKDYDMWYAEYRPAPSFYYDFKIWQYTKEGSVPGIEGKVPISLALKKYSG